MKYKCLIFDCDGVLVDSESISNGVMIKMANSIGAKIELDYANKYFSGKSLKSIFLEIENITDKKLPDSFESEYRTKTFDSFKNDLKAIKGVKKILNLIKVPYCVASSGPREKIELNLTTTGLIDNFKNNIFSSYEIDSWKPEPQIFLHSAKMMGFKAGDCAVIEDSIAGVIAGKKGGFDVFGYANGNNDQELIDAGAKVFYSMDELAELLNLK